MRQLLKSERVTRMIRRNIRLFANGHWYGESFSCDVSIATAADMELYLIRIELN